MDAKFDERTILTKLIDKLDALDMKQILAFVAGYEAGKMDQMPDVHTSEKNQCPLTDRSKG